MLERAFGKVNLALDIVGRRGDGYHDLKMLLQGIDFCDEVEILPARELQVTTDRPDVPDGPGNLAFKAVLLMSERSGRKPNVQVRITKRIFAAAGLAGGSADAAAVLRGLNRLWSLFWPAEKLEKLAAELGSDVPFCIRGGTVLATGRGEILEPLPDLDEHWLVLAKPRIEVSTAWAYRNYSAAAVTERPKLAPLLAAVQANDRQALYAGMGNVLESVTCRTYKEITAIKEEMVRAGAARSLMSGSGPTVFGLVDSQEKGEAVLAAVTNKFDVETVLTKTLRRNES